MIVENRKSNPTLKNGLFLDGNWKERKQNEDLGVHGADPLLDLLQFSRDG